MKKTIIAAVLAAAFLMTACSTAQETETSASEEATTTTTESTTEVTTATTTETTPVTLDLTIEQVRDQIVNSCSLQLDDDNWQSGVERDETFAFEGITNHVGLSKTKTEIIDNKSCSNVLNFDIFECDTNSEFYTNLSVGDTFSAHYVFHYNDETTSEFDISWVVTAINKQYIVSLIDNASVHYADSTPAENSSETASPFSNEELQSIYDAFVALGN